MSFSTDAVLLALLIFGLRLLNSAMATIRIVIMTRHRRWLSSIIATVEALIFAVTVGSVVSDLGNILNLAAYSGGFGVGSFIGMILEERFITSYLMVHIVSASNGHDMAVMLRDRGYGVTESIGEGRDGSVTLLQSVITRRELPGLLQAAHAVNPEAFVSVEEAAAVHRGWLRATRNQK